MCSAEEEQCLLRLGVEKLKHPVAFFTPKAIPEVKMPQRALWADSSSSSA